jgi:hypothetical protein
MYEGDHISFEEENSLSWPRISRLFKMISWKAVTPEVTGGWKILDELKKPYYLRDYINNRLSRMKRPGSPDIGLDPILEFYFCRKGSGRCRPDEHRPSLGAGKLK